MSGQLSITYIDFDGDRKQTSYPVFEASSVNYATWDSAMDDLQGAFSAVSAGNLAIVKKTGVVDVVSDSNALAPVAQAHIRAVLQYEDNVTKKIYQDLFIACPDLGNAGLWTISGGKTVWNTSDVAWVDVKTQFELSVYSKDGNNCTLLLVYIEE